MGRRASGKAEYQRVRGDSGHHRRILALMAVLAVLTFVPTALRLYGLMIRDHEYYSNLALRNQSRSTPVTADRGTLYDRNMNILACSTGVENIYLAPRELKQSGADLTAVSENLGRILDQEPEAIRKKAENTSLRYQQVAANVEEDIAGAVRNYINENHISGIHLEPGTKRTYPFGTLAAQVIGFTNASNTGSEGVEAAYNSFLSGTAGRVITTKGNNEMDMPYSYENYLRSVPGCDVILTLDTVVQTCLEEELTQAMKRYDVQNGAFGLVMNVKTGEILAMATLGSYDPNAYLDIADIDTADTLEQLRQKYLQYSPGTEGYELGRQSYQETLTAARLKQWRNRCISDGYEPGSTFKVMTMAAALDSGAIDLETSFHCSGSEQIPGRSQLLHCWRSAGHGAEKTPQALQNSCNVAFAHIALKMGGETFYEYVRNFGILEKTGIDLAGESGGIFFDKALVTDTDKWGTASLTSGSFGQTFKITPLQLVRAISAVVNGGTLMEPYLVSEVVDAKGNTVLKQEPTAVRQVIRKETSETMCRLLESVVVEGTAKNASVSGYSIGGKTGTSEKIDVFDENGQRVLDKIVSFVGIAPMDDPQYIVLAALDTPSRETGIYISGGVMAAPTVGAVMERILPYLEVERTASAEADALPVLLADYSGMTAEEAKAALEEKGLTCRMVGTAPVVTGQIPAAGQSVPGGSEVLLYFGPPVPEETVTVPDFFGMNRKEAADTAADLGLYILVSGNTNREPTVTVAEQSVPPETPVRRGSTITLKFIDTKAAG